MLNDPIALSKHSSSDHQTADVSTNSSTGKFNLQDGNRHDQQLHAFFYTCFILLSYALLILYFMLRQVCKKLNQPAGQQPSVDPKVIESVAEYHNSAAEFRRIQQDRWSRAHEKQRLCIHLARMGRSLDSISNPSETDTNLTVFSRHGSLPIEARCGVSGRQQSLDDSLSGSDIFSDQGGERTSPQPSSSIETHSINSDIHPQVSSTSMIGHSQHTTIENKRVHFELSNTPAHSHETLSKQLIFDNTIHYV